MLVLFFVNHFTQIYLFVLTTMILHFLSYFYFYLVSRPHVIHEVLGGSLRVNTFFFFFFLISKKILLKRSILVY